MTVHIQRFTAQDVRRHRADFVELLCNVVDNGASVNFLAPLDPVAAAAFWDTVAGAVEAGDRIILAAVEDERVVGSIQLVLAHQQNGRHRAEVQKVFVHTRARRRGIAKQMMIAIEDAARSANRHLLVLDTERDSSAEALYQGVGYVRVGAIPQFALNFDGTQLIDTVLYYKLLPTS